MTEDLHDITVQELYQKLIKYYPEIDYGDLGDWAEALANHDDTFSLPQTQAMSKYRAIDSEMKKLEEDKKSLRKDLITQFKDLDHQVAGFSFREDTRVKYDDDKLFAWVKSEYPELLEELRSNVINLKKLEEFIALGAITVPTEDCYTLTTVPVITPSKGK